MVIAMLFDDLEIMNKIYGVQISKPLCQMTILKGLSLLSDIEREKFNKFRYWKDAQLFLTGRVIVKIIISQYIHMDIEDIIIKIDRYGKPYLSKIQNIQFNISHSGDWVVVAFSTGHIGIDIEKIGDFDVDIAKTYFLDTEFQELYQNKNIKKKERFFEYWTLKESYVKFKGLGLFIPLNSFEIKFEGESISVCQEKHVNLRIYKFDEDYKLAVCTEKKESIRHIKQYDINKFIEI